MRRTIEVLLDWVILHGFQWIEKWGFPPTGRYRLWSHVIFAENAKELASYQEVWFARVYETVEDFVVQPGWKIVDIGANIGAFSLSVIEKASWLLAVEPNPQVYERLKKNLGRNSPPSDGIYQTLNCALSSASGEGFLHLENDASCSGYIAPGKSQKGFRIEMCTLDSVKVDWPDKIDLIKIDVEGHEIHVLLGGQKVLSKTERVVFEYHSDTLYHMCRGFLEKIGFVERLRSGANIGVAYFSKSDGR